MSLKKVRKKVEKIQRTIELLDGEVSSIERDLLLVYIRDLYEEVLDLTGEKVPSSSSEPVVVPPKKEVLPDPPVAAEPETSVQESKEEALVEEMPAEEAEEPANEDLMRLFEVQEAEELGDKLSKLPIKDLTKAMSINERIFTINELFGGDHDMFSETLDHVNGLNNYQEAVDYLVKGVAAEHDWEDPQHLKKAEKFIHLVQRRFK